MKDFKVLRATYNAMTMKELNRHLAKLRSYRLDGLSKAQVTDLRRKINLVKIVIQEKTNAS